LKCIIDGWFGLLKIWNLRTSGCGAGLLPLDKIGGMKIWFADVELSQENWILWLYSPALAVISTGAGGGTG